jgi:nitroreductase
MDFSEFFGFLTSRSSVRDYDTAPLLEEVIAYILSCACTAPSAGNLESWDVVVVTDEEVRFALAEAAYGQEHIAKAPAVFVVCANYVRSMSRYGERGIMYAIEDASIACTYMMLAAHARQVHTCWTGAFDEEEVRDVLSLPPHIRPVSLLAAGHGHPPPLPTGRMAAGEHVHRDIW